MALKQEKQETDSSKAVDESLEKTLRNEVKSLKLDLKQSLERERANKLNFDKATRKAVRLEAELATRIPPKETGNPKENESKVIVPASSAGSTTQSKPEAPAPNITEHIVEWIPKWCPECGTVNAGFKDEVRCADCGISLGSEKYAKHKMKNCPNCGSARGYEASPGYDLVHTKAGCTGPDCKVKI